MSEPTVSVPKVPTAGHWWNTRHGLVRVRIGAGGRVHWTTSDGEEWTGDGGEWLAPVLTPAEVAALTDERDEARRWAEAAAADENANAAELREARATLAMVRKAADALDGIGWRDLESCSADESYGMNVAGLRLRVMLEGGDRE